MQYHVQAGQILYTVIQNCLPGICGVTNVFSGKDMQAIEAEYPRWEAELCAAGLGTMDFDGVFAPNPDFLQVITRCAHCRKILSIPVRRNRTHRELTIFFCEDSILALEQVQEQTYILHTECELETLVPQFLQLPARTVFLESCSIDSSLIQQKNLLEMVCEGCDPDIAQLVVDAASGIAGYAQILRIEDLVAQDMQTLLCNENGILLVSVAYTQMQEQMHLQPISVSEVCDYVRTSAEYFGG